MTVNAEATLDSSGNVPASELGHALANPMTAAGDMIYGGTGGAATRLVAQVGPGQLLQSGTTPGWVIPFQYTAESASFTAIPWRGHDVTAPAVTATLPAGTSYGPINIRNTSSGTATIAPTATYKIDGSTSSQSIQPGAWVTYETPDGDNYYTMASGYLAQQSGSSGQVLRSSGAGSPPLWASPPSVSDVSSSLVAGSALATGSNVNQATSISISKTGRYMVVATMNWKPNASTAGSYVVTLELLGGSSGATGLAEAQATDYMTGNFSGQTLTVTWIGTCNSGDTLKLNVANAAGSATSILPWTGAPNLLNIFQATCLDY